MDRLARLFIELALDSGSFLSQLNRLSGQVLPIAQKIGRSIIRGVSRILRAGFRTLAVTALAVLGTAFAAGIGSINIASAFETEFAKINAVLQTSRNEADALRKSLIDIGLNPNFKISIQEAADTALVLAKNGLTAAEIMGGALEASTALANATTQEFGKSADIATDLVKIFKLENDKLGDAVNGAVGAINSSKFGLNDYRLSLGQAGQAAAIAGVDIDDFNTVIAGTANSFTSGSDAGTSFKVFLQRTIPQTERASVAMQKLGLQTTNYDTLQRELNDTLATAGPAAMKRYENALEAGKSQQEVLRATLGLTRTEFLRYAQDTNILESAFFDLNGEMNSMEVISRAMAKGMEDLGNEQEVLAALTDAFGTDALRTAAALGQLGTAIPVDGRIQEFARQLGFTNDQVKEFAKLEPEAQMDELREVMGLTKDEFHQVGIEAGFLTTEWLELSESIEATNAFEIAQQQINTLSGSFEIFKDQLTQFGVSFGSVLAPALKFFNKVGSAVLETFLPQFTKVGEAGRMFATELFGGLEEQLQQEGLGSVLDTLGLSQFIDEGFITRFENFRDRATSIAESFMDTFTNPRFDQLNVMDRLFMALNEQGEFALADRVRDLQRAFEDFRNGNFEGMLENLGFSDDQIQNIREIKENLSEIGSSLRELFDFELDGDFSALETINNTLKFIVENEEAIKNVTTALAILAGVFAAISVVAPIVNGAMLTFQGIMWVIGGIATITLTPALIAVGTALAIIVIGILIADALLSQMGSSWEELAETIEMAGFLSAHFTGVAMTAIYDWFVWAWDSVSEYWDDTVQPWWDGLNPIIQGVVLLITGQFGVLALKWQEVWDEVQRIWDEVAVPIWEDFQEWLQEKLPVAAEVFTASLILNLRTILNYLTPWWFGSVLTIFQDARSWFQEKFPAAAAAMRDAVVEALDKIIEKITGFQDAVSKARDAWSSFKSFVSTPVNAVLNLVHKTVDTITRSPMRIHTRAMEFAEFLEKTPFNLALDSNSGSVMDGVNSAVMETVSNVQGLSSEIDNALTERKFGISMDADSELGLRGANNSLKSIESNIARLEGNLSSTVGQINSNSESATGDTITQVFNEGSVLIPIESNDVENEDDFAQFLARRLLGDA